MSTATIEQTRRVSAGVAGAPRSGVPTATRTATHPTTPGGASTSTRPAVRAGRDAAQEAATDGAGGIAPFVLLTMVLLASGLVATLWLSTAAAADSYRLDEARQVARDLSEQSERLHREVEGARSAPALAAAAQAQGMVPGGDPTVLLVAPDGATRVIGDARPAKGAPKPQAAPAPAARAATAPATPPAPAAEEDQLRAVPVTTTAAAG